MSMTTWNKQLGRFDDEVRYRAPNDEAWDVEFDNGYGLPEGPEVLAWSNEWVYFPVCYDGYESLGRAPRNPRSEGQEHEGGY